MTDRRPTPLAFDGSAFMQALMNALEKHDQNAADVVACINSVRSLLVDGEPVRLEFAKLPSDPRDILQSRARVGESVEQGLGELLELLGENLRL